MIAKHVLNIHRTAGNAPERDDSDKKVRAMIRARCRHACPASGERQRQPERKCALDAMLDPSSASCCVHASWRQHAYQDRQGVAKVSLELRRLVAELVADFRNGCSQEEAFLKRYLEYCRSRSAPVLSETAGRVLANEYVELREEVRALPGSCPRIPSGLCGRRMLQISPGSAGPKLGHLAHQETAKLMR